jgi:hypothetical protein
MRLFRIDSHFKIYRIALFGYFDLRFMLRAAALDAPGKRTRAGRTVVLWFAASLFLASPTVPTGSAATPAALYRLPAGPAEARRFGAFYTRLRYDPAWESAWRVGDYPDVLVTFDKLPVRFVFWRGTSMIPCWVSETGVWYRSEFVERSGGGTQGCAEPMSDKQCRFSSARILENTPAHVVVHWRYSPVDVNYTQPWVNQATGWGDWVDEYYALYPDGIGVREITLHSTALNEWAEFFESIVINQPGTYPKASIEPGAVTLANLAGDASTWRWTEKGSPEQPATPPRACIHRINLKAQYKPFVLFPEGVTFEPYGGHEPGRLFHFWNHWPVAQEKSWTTEATSADKPSHTSFSHVGNWPALKQSEGRVTRIMLHGMSDQPMDELVKVARSWLKPPACAAAGGGGACRLIQPSALMSLRGPSLIIMPGSS